MKNRLKKQLNIILLSLMLTITGCAKNNDSIKYSNECSKTEETTEYNNRIIKDNNTIYINDYEEYKTYLSELNPSYDLLRETIKNNKNINQTYQDVLLKIVDIFEKNKVDNHNLAIFYENLKKLVVNTNYSVDLSSDSFVGAFFTPDADTPSITVDGENVDFYLFLHEVIHSCHELKIRYDDKIIYITAQEVKEVLNSAGEKEIELSGIGFIEGQTEFISNYLYNSSKHLFTSSKNYNNANDIIDFVYDTQALDFNTFFLFNTKDFKNILLNINIPKEQIDDIMSKLDYQTINEINNSEARTTFYNNYIPKIVEQ